MKEYTIHVEFDMNIIAEDKELAARIVLNKLHFPGHAIANLDVKVKSFNLPDEDKQVRQGGCTRRKENNQVLRYLKKLSSGKVLGDGIPIIKILTGEYSMD